MGVFCLEFVRYLFVIPIKNGQKRRKAARGRNAKNRITMGFIAVNQNLLKVWSRSTNQKVAGSNPSGHANKNAAARRFFCWRATFAGFERQSAAACGRERRTARPEAVAKGRIPPGTPRRSKKSRSAHLFGCKRPRDGSLSLPTFCG